MPGRAAKLGAVLVAFAFGGAPLGAPSGLALTSAARAETITLPGDAATGAGRNAQIYQVSCPAAGDCVGVGYYSDTSGNHQALIEGESAGSWSASEVPAGLLSSDGSPPQPELTSVACTAAFSCVATDAFDESMTDEQGLIDTEVGGAWTPSVAPLGGLPSVYSNPGVEVTPVACPAVDACVGVGNYGDGSDNLEGLIETQSPTGWSASELQPPQSVALAGFAPAFYDLSCPAPASCTAVGDFGPSSDQQGLLATDAAGRWTSTALDLSQLRPAPAINPDVLVQAVSCPDAGDCTAVGTFADDTNTIEAFAVGEVAGTWQPVTLLTLPSGASSSAGGAGIPVQTDLYLNGVSCASAGDCTAVGSYDAAGNVVEAFSVTETAGTWSPGAETGLPSSDPAPASNAEATLDSVSCQGAGDCLAAGTYVTATNDNAVLVARQASGGWSSAGVDLTSAYDPSPPVQAPYWASVACATGGYCAAGGAVADNTTGNEDAFLLDAPGAPAATPTATLGGSQATVSWQAPSDDGGLPISGYSVIASDLTDPSAGDQSVTAAASATSATLAGLSPGDSYSFTVAAQSLLGSGVPATSAQVTMPAPPPGGGSTSSTTTSTAPAQTATTPTTATVTAAPSRARIAASLAGLLAPHVAGDRLRRLLRAHGYTFSYRALEAGLVNVRWYQVSGRGRHRNRRLAGSGSARVTAGRPVRIVLRLTVLGRRLLAAGGRVKLTAVVSFGGGGLIVSRTHVFTLP